MKLLLTSGGGSKIFRRTYGTVSTLLSFDVCQRPANGSLGLGDRTASGLKEFEAGAHGVLLASMWFVFDLWNRAAGRVSGFHPQGRSLWRRS